MHIHQSIVSTQARQNVFSQSDGEASPLFLLAYQWFYKDIACGPLLLAPNINSYRRIQRYNAAPINVQWGLDNRTAGLRVPDLIA